MDKDSIKLMQRVDCNCNDCGYMVRDISRYKLSQIFHEELDRDEFRRNRNTELFIGYTLKEKQIVGKALKVQFKPKKPITQFGYCKKFDFKPISFLPGVCQLGTQSCFKHRDEFKII